MEKYKELIDALDSNPKRLSIFKADRRDALWHVLHMFKVRCGPELDPIAIRNDAFEEAAERCDDLAKGSSYNNYRNAYRLAAMYIRDLIPKIQKMSVSAEPTDKPIETAFVDDMHPIPVKEELGDGEVRVMVSESIDAGTKQYLCTTNIGVDLTIVRTSAYEELKAKADSTDEAKYKSVECVECKGSGCLVTYHAASRRSERCHRCNGKGHTNELARVSDVVNVTISTPVHSSDFDTADVVEHKWYTPRGLTGIEYCSVCGVSRRWTKRLVHKQWLRMPHTMKYTALDGAPLDSKPLCTTKSMPSGFHAQIREMIAKATKYQRAQIIELQSALDEFHRVRKLDLDKHRVEVTTLKAIVENYEEGAEDVDADLEKLKLNLRVANQAHADYVSKSMRDRKELNSALDKRRVEVCDLQMMIDNHEDEVADLKAELVTAHQAQLDQAARYAKELERLRIENAVKHSHEFGYDSRRTIPTRPFWCRPLLPIEKKPFEKEQRDLARKLEKEIKDKLSTTFNMAFVRSDTRNGITIRTQGDAVTITDKYNSTTLLRSNITILELDDTDLDIRVNGYTTTIVCGDKETAEWLHNILRNWWRA